MARRGNGNSHLSDGGCVGFGRVEHELVVDGESEFFDWDFPLSDMMIKGEQQSYSEGKKFTSRIHIGGGFGSILYKVYT